MKWTDKKYSKDWRADGYLRRQDSGKKKLKILHNGKPFFKYYFKLRIDQGEYADAFTHLFNKRAYIHEDYPNQVLVIYDGDESVVNKKYSNGNATHKEKTDKPYFRTAPSVLETAKARPNEPPSKVHDDIIGAAPLQMKIQAVEASRDIEQVRNCQRFARETTLISHDTQFNAYEIGSDTNFVRNFEIFPHLRIACLHFGKQCVIF